MLVDKNEFFREATIRICSSLDIEKGLSRCLLYIKKYMPVDGLMLHLLEENEGRYNFRLVSDATIDGIDRLQKVKPFPNLQMETLIQKIVSEKWPICKKINDPSKEQKLVCDLFQVIWGRKNMSTIELHLGLELHQHLRTNRIGGFTIYSFKKNQYTDEHVELISLLREPLTLNLSNILRYKEVKDLKELLADDNSYLREELHNQVGHKIIGAENGLSGVMEMVRQVSPLDSPVLLMGETGVGKEIIANAIHNSSLRKDGPFIKVNCGAFPENLIDSELFGHEKGAFTGAAEKKRGRFERANNGTLFLDEIGELPLKAQVKMLRVLQHKEIERIGGTSVIPVDIRIISATNRNLEQMIAEGSFREDLWFRLNIFPIMLPPLRQRKDDISDFLYHFIEKKTRELKLKYVPRIKPDVIDYLKEYHWPGNVRELENMVERALIQNQGSQPAHYLSFEKFSLPGPKENSHIQIPVAEDQFIPLEKLNIKYINSVLDHTKGRIHGPYGAANILGINPNTLRTRMKKLGIPFRRR